MVQHVINLFFRTGKDGNLELDGTNVYAGSSGGILAMLNTEGNIYIGKLWAITALGGRYHKL